MIDETIKNKLYPVQLWLTSIVFFAPVIFIIVELFNDTDYSGNSSNVGIFVLLILFGILFSVPTFLVTLLIYELAYHKISSAFLIQVLINTISIAGIFITLTLISGSMIPQLKIIYTASVILTSLVLKVNKKREIYEL